MKTFNSIEEFSNYMTNRIIPKLVDKLADDFMDILKKRINIDTYGYDENGKLLKNDYYENGTGIPTYEFRDDAWEKKTRQSIKGFLSEVFYQPENLTPPSEERPFTHGSYGIWGDFRKYLPYVLEGMAQQGSLFPARERDPFWKNTIDEFKGSFEILLKKRCKELGIDLI